MTYHDAMRTERERARDQALVEERGDAPMKVWVAIAIPVQAPLSGPRYVAAGNTAAAAKASLMSQLGEDPCKRVDGVFFVGEAVEVEVVQEYKP